VPSQSVNDDLPTYQHSALVRFVAARVVARATARREVQHDEESERPARARRRARPSRPDTRAPDRPAVEQHGVSLDDLHLDRRDGNTAQRSKERKQRD
jgi:hypothetical protein